MAAAAPPAFDALAENAPCGLLLTNTDGTIRRINATLARWLGYAADDLVDKRRIQDLLTMGGRVFHQTHWAPLLQIQGSVAEVKLEMRHSDGHSVPMLLNAICRSHDEAQYHELAFMVVNDRHKYERELLLARRNAEAALAARAEAERELNASRDELRLANALLWETDRKKDEFLATLAHELRNPLAPMRNVVEVLGLKSELDQQTRWAVDMIQRQLSHMTHLVDDLMEVSRITQGKLELRKQALSLADILRNAIEASRTIIDMSSHELIVALPDETVVLSADPTRLTQVFQNLLNNAAKYTPAGGRIWLSAERQGSDAVVVVRDSGIGIPQEKLASVFNMFSQLAPALERSQGGLGIGLALVRGLIELHAGSVTAHSDGPGCGSEFAVRLPLGAPGELPQEIAQCDVPVRAQKRRILVVDDNEDAATSLSILLELQGHDVFIASDGLSALRVAGEMNPEIVLLDIGLPGLDGYEVARRIRTEPWGAQMMLIAITGWGQQQDKQIAVDAGFDFHLTKPVEHAQLVRLIARTEG
jgi:PAS domain S-box-containing protein